MYPPIYINIYYTPRIIFLLLPSSSQVVEQLVGQDDGQSEHLVLARTAAHPHRHRDVVRLLSGLGSIVSP